MNKKTNIVSSKAFAEYFEQKNDQDSSEIQAVFVICYNSIFNVLSSVHVHFFGLLWKKWENSTMNGKQEI